MRGRARPPHSWGYCPAPSPSPRHPAGPLPVGARKPRTKRPHLSYASLDDALGFLLERTSSRLRHAFPETGNAFVVRAARHLGCGARVRFSPAGSIRGAAWRSRAPPVRWPRSSALCFDDRRWNLLIFVHPACPCSRASIDELAYVMARCGDKTAAHAVLVVPERTPEGWSLSEVERQLAAVPKLRSWVDKGAIEADRFRVATSGHVLLYDRQGRLVFSGGITPARGHVGQSYGRDALLAHVGAGGALQPSSPVFGCQLTRPQSITKEEPPR